MSSFPADLVQDSLAALRLYQQWGVDEVIEDLPWAVWEEHNITKAPQVAPAKGRKRSPIQPPIGPKPGTGRSTAEIQAAIATAKDGETLMQLAQQIEGVTLARTATHHLAPVFVEGAPFLLIGDVPNADEDRSGVLFSGPDGKLLARMLASIGLQRAEVSMAPAIPWRPPGGQPVAERELQACLPILHRIITLCRPKRIVTLGATAPGMLLGDASPRLNQLRGQWHSIHVAGIDTPIALLPLLHPAQLGGRPLRRKALWEDLLLLGDTLLQDGAIR